MNARIRQRLYYYFVDHGLLRLLYGNFYRLPGGLYRSNQPSPERLRRLAERYQIKTVVNLRGGDTTNPSWQLERAACERLGLKMIDLRLFSRSFPYVEDVHKLKQTIETLELPALVHCKSGADRAGLFCAFYQHYRLGQPVAFAVKELSLKYGHFKWARTGALDQFFQEFLNATENSHHRTLIGWVEETYDRQYLKTTRPERNLLERFSNFLVDKVLKRE